MDVAREEFDTKSRTEIKHWKLHKSDPSEDDLPDMPMYHLGQK